MCAEPIKASAGSVFFQLTPGKAPVYMSCLDTEALTQPAGDQTLINCRNSDGNVVAIGSSTGVPGAVTTGLKAFVFPEYDVLDQLGNCYFSIYYTLRNCGKAGQFSNWIRAYILHHGRVTSKSLENLAHHEADEAVTRNFSMAGWNPIYEVRATTIGRSSIAETSDLNSIAFCNAAQCAGPCGEQQDAGKNGFIGGDAIAGSPATRADIWSTKDYGAAWANIAGAAAHPFAAGEAITSVGCTSISATVSRWFAARGQVAAEPLKIAYSDNEGATWTLVTVGATNNEGVLNGKAMQVMDRDHLYVITSAGNVYFSDDAGVTWTVKAAAIIADGGVAMQVICFSDFSNGYAGGAASTLMVTHDGGDTWTVVTLPVAMNITALHAWDTQRLILGSSTGLLYETWDGGANIDVWDAKTFVGQDATGTVKTIVFVNENVGYMIYNTAAPVGSVHKSIDGGHTWDALTTPTNAGLNDLVAIDNMVAWAVGNASGGTGTILKIYG